MKVKVIKIPKNESIQKVKVIALPKNQTGGNATPVTKGLPKSLRHLGNIEAEGGEVYESKNGSKIKINNSSPDHERGGVMLPDANRVLEDTSTSRKDRASKALKIHPDELDTIFGVKSKSPVSHAKAFELVKKDYAKQVDKVNAAQKRINNAPGKIDKYGVSSAKLNFTNRDDIPNEDTVFDTLFEHQEGIKAQNGISNDGKVHMQYGGYKRQTGGSDDLGLYRGPKNKANLYTPTGQTSEAKLTDKQIIDAYSAIGVDLKGLRGKELQNKIYSYVVDNDPDVLRDVIKRYGYNKAAKNAGKQNIKAFKDPDNASVADLKAAIPYLSDAMPGARIPLPSDESSIEQIPQGATINGQPIRQSSQYNGEITPPGRQQRQSQQTRNGLQFTSKQGNEFYEPTNWYDIAPAFSEYIDALGREPELFNPQQFHELQYKQLNPTAALQANQEDYTGALQELNQAGKYSGQGSRAANIANLYAQKIKGNNQIIGQYENENTQIKNNEIGYNTKVRDLQSDADSRTRANYYEKVLQSRDNGRLQKLQAIQDLSRVAQLKARQNTSGNLVLKMSPHYNQEGEYNGNPYIPVLPNDMDNGTFIPQPTQKRLAYPRTTTTRTWKDPSGEVYRNSTVNVNQ